MENKNIKSGKKLADLKEQGKTLDENNILIEKLKKDE